MIPAIFVNVALVPFSGAPGNLESLVLILILAITQIAMLVGGWRLV
jgi:hypothetical protein